jgi:dTDP-L-rhamnose 4-epimerase
MKILITGGAGFIGTKVIKKLMKTNEIIVLDNFSKQIHGDNPKLLNGINYIIGDVRNLDDWTKAMEFNPEIIVHLAAETGTGQSMDEINRYVSTNIVGTSIMLDLVNSGKYNVKKIILSSSRSVYGDSINHENNQILEPKSIYGLTKLTQESLIKISSKIPYTILRFQNVYGEGQSTKNPK